MKTKDELSLFIKKVNRRLTAFEKTIDLVEQKFLQLESIEEENPLSSQLNKLTHKYFDLKGLVLQIDFQGSDLELDDKTKKQISDLSDKITLLHCKLFSMPAAWLVQRTLKQVQLEENENRI